MLDSMLIPYSPYGYFGALVEPRRFLWAYAHKNHLKSVTPTLVALTAMFLYAVIQLISVDRKRGFVPRFAP
jgi:hypothetical protein